MVPELVGGILDCPYRILRLEDNKPLASSAYRVKTAQSAQIFRDLGDSNHARLRSRSMSLAKPEVVIVIPARFGSTRLPGKPLVSLAGRPMIQRVYERAKLASRADRVIVATDDERIVKAVESFGGAARMTRPDHRTGTERVAEVAAHEKGDVFVNVQGDEPLLDPVASTPRSMPCSKNLPRPSPRLPPPS